MNAFVSWSGGKDCMLALHRFLTDKDNTVVSLVNMCDDVTDYSRSHGIHKSFIVAQAHQLGFKLIQKNTNRKEYELNFKTCISQLKKEGVTAGVFGDIYLREHRDWIERVCSDMDIRPVFPLWENPTNELLNEFIGLGYKSRIVSLRKDCLPNDWLGRNLDSDFFSEIVQLEGVDPCAENGEYHTFVYDGPLFEKPVTFDTGMPFEQDNHYFLPLNLTGNA